MDVKLKAGDLLEFINAFKPLTDEANTVSILLHPEGFYTRYTDSAHVAHVDANLPKQAFEKYAPEKEMFECYPHELSDFLTNFTKPEQSVELKKSGENEKRKYFVTIGNLTKKFERPIHGDLAKNINLNLPAYTIIQTEEIRKACRAIKPIADGMKFRCAPDTLYIEGCNKETRDDVEVKIELKDLEHRCEAKFASVMPLDYVQSIANAIQGPTVKLSFGTDYPIKIEYATKAGGTIKYLIAPRVEQD